MAKGMLGTTTFVSSKPVCATCCEFDAGSWSFGCVESRKGVVVSLHCCCSCDVKSGRGLAVTVDMTAARIKYLRIAACYDDILYIICSQRVGKGNLQLILVGVFLYLGFPFDKYIRVSPTILFRHESCPDFCGPVSYWRRRTWRQCRSF